ncbi:MAG: energy-coupling factor transporter transmembrane component T family protein [Propionibacteriaceae bacterium]
MNILNRCNPVTRLLAAVIVTSPLLATLDWLSAKVALVLEILGFLGIGLAPIKIVKRILPLLVMAPLSGISMLFYAAPAGKEFFSWGLIHITEGSIYLAIAMMLRVLALSVPVVLLLAEIDATDLADGLAQVCKLPARFVLGTLAGARMMSLLVADWRRLGQARRARGLGDGGRFRRFVTMTFALLVFALRRGQKLATAMEVRQFDTRKRTWARRSTVGRFDAALLAVAVAIVAIALGAAVLAGTFHTVWAR